MNTQKNTAVGLLILRIGLGVFLLLWSIDKLAVPEGTVRVFSTFIICPFRRPLSLSLACSS